MDKYRLLQNIKIMAKRKNIKIGDLEANAQVSKGYLSRLSSPDSGSPSLESMLLIADQLGTTLQVLIDANLSDVGESNQLSIEFLNKMIVDTQNEKITWHWVSTSDVEDYRSISPLLYGFESGEGLEKCKFRSRFFDGESLVITDVPLYCLLPSAKYTMWIIPLRERNSKNLFLESYLEADYSNLEFEPFVHSRYKTDKISKLLEMLYAEAKLSFDRQTLSAMAKGILREILDGGQI